MATVRVLYFAGLRDAVGRGDETVPLAPGLGTVAALCDHLASVHPGYGAARAHVRVAHNEVFARGDEALADGDVVALLPPVAGG